VERAVSFDRRINRRRQDQGGRPRRTCRADDPNCDTQVPCTAGRFALVAIGGEVAIELGVVPWSHGSVIQSSAMRKLDRPRGGCKNPAEIREGIS
jgi:hypothetical protein